MKLLPSMLLGGAVSLQTGLGPLQSIHMAHSRVRQAFTIPEMDMITSQNERLLDEVFAEDFSSRLVSLDEMISRSENITTQFRAQVKNRVFERSYLTPIWYISGISRSVISGKKIQNLLFDL